ncbi:hypothetical protein ACWHAM_12335 [Paenibacillus terrae]|uniref:Heparinase II/III n=1 Tax=Paenibacillus terrae (strain HPL-003) TaxID=985665 RepID=G7VZM4_PAETH|nr:Heparinase II/III [Paenibacillus terrae HPL-003]
MAEQRECNIEGPTGVNPDGSWPESIRYHHAALERFAGYAKVLENVTGENWFESTTLLHMFRYSVGSGLWGMNTSAAGYPHLLLAKGL